MFDSDNLFSDKVGSDIVEDITKDIAYELFDSWNDSNLNEGSQYAEWQFFSYAGNEIKRRYNEHYGYTKDDEYYLEVK